MTVWPYRDWVIRAFNENLPYDQFITWQTAGDLLPNPTRDQMIATAFNRLAQQSNEAGSNPEEFRIEQVADRVHTNGTAFLGLTLECARCHDQQRDLGGASVLSVKHGQCLHGAPASVRLLADNHGHCRAHLA